MAARTPPLVLAADAAIDLQMHTTFSDGTWQPEQLLDYLAAEGFGLVAVTDHDRTDTATAMQTWGARRGLPVLAAVEMSTSWRGEATDVLCYGFDPREQELRALGQHAVQRQLEINEEVYIALLRRGYAFPHREDVLQKTRDQPLLMHDLGRLLEQHGYSTGPGSVGQIMSDAGFYFATNDIAEVVAAAHHSGAVCIIAHPGRGDGFMRYDAGLLDELCREVPIDGLEAYYPLHTPDQTTMYLEYAQAHGLVVSSGSDSHGPEKKPIKYRADLSRRLLERLGIEIAEEPQG